MNQNSGEYLKAIYSNIKTFGYHLNIVSGNSQLPRFAYTIGLTETIGFEFIFAGGEIYKASEIEYIISEIILAYKQNNTILIQVNPYGNFSLGKVDDSWSQLTMLGVYHYYDTNNIKALQILPDLKNFTIEIPNMASVYDFNKEKIWQWLVKDWEYEVPKNSVVITNTATLFGIKITEVTRWEEGEWEAFTEDSSNIDKSDLRILPLGTVLGIDQSLKSILMLEIGKGIWRDKDELQWNEWE
jgi:hypothetical protein